MNRIALTRNALSGVGQVVVTSVVTFGLYQFLNRHLTIAQIGVWSVVLASAAAGRLIDLGLGGGVVKFVASHLGRGSRLQAGTTVQMALAGMTVLFTVASVMLFPLLHAGLKFLIKDSSSLTEAWQLLPFALGSLIVGALAGVISSALDGCQRMDLRALLGIIGAVMQLGCAIVLVPKMGLLGLAIGQVVQSLSILLIGGLLLLRLIGPELLSFRGWRRSAFLELVRYGSGFQAAAVGQILFEPALKAVLSRYGGLEFTGYYEMSNRLVLQARSILVSGYQSLVPFIAGATRSSNELRGIYDSAYQLLFFFAACSFGLLGLMLPFILEFWLGHFAPKFSQIADLCLLGWAFNTLNVTAYYMFLGTGELRWPVISHALIGIFATGAGIFFGNMFGGFGALGAVTVVLIVGSHLVTFAFHSRHQIPLRWLFPPGTRGIFLLSILGSVAVSWSSQVSGTSWNGRSLGIAIVFAGTIISLAIANPNSSLVMSMLRKVRQRAE